MYGLPSKMKSSSHKTLQTPLLFLKPLQIQNLKRKKWGGHGILCPPHLKKWGGTRSPCPPPNCAHDWNKHDCKTDSDKDQMALSRHYSENHSTINKPPLQKHTPLLLSNNQVVTLWISVKINGITQLTRKSTFRT